MWRGAALVSHEEGATALGAAGARKALHDDEGRLLLAGSAANQASVAAFLFITVFGPGLQDLAQQGTSKTQDKGLGLNMHDTTR